MTASDTALISSLPPFDVSSRTKPCPAKAKEANVNIARIIFFVLDPIP
jgi:hypothetical protein